MKVWCKERLWLNWLLALRAARITQSTKSNLVNNIEQVVLRRMYKASFQLHKFLVPQIYYGLLLLLLLLSPLCEIFAILETIHISRIYNVTAVLWLQFVVGVILFSITHFVSFTLVLSEVRAHWPIWLFPLVARLCAFNLCCSDIFWNIMRWFQVSYIITDITFGYLFHISCISLVRSIHF